MSLDALPDDWVVWSEETDGRVVLAYRPDVFDSTDYPAECLPTMYVTRGKRSRRRPGVDPRDVADAGWSVYVYLEPDVGDDPERFETRAAAVDAAVDVARAFAEGRFDYRSLYQVPREAYLEKLDELTGRDA